MVQENNVSDWNLPSRCNSFSACRVSLSPRYTVTPDYLIHFVNTLLGIALPLVPLARASDLLSANKHLARPNFNTFTHSNSQIHTRAGPLLSQQTLFNQTAKMSRQMRAALLLLVVCLAATSAQGKMEVKRRQVDVHREIKARQILGGPGDAGTQQESAAASGGNAAAAPVATTPVAANPVSPSPAAEAPDATTTSQPLNPLTGLFPAPSRQTTAGQVTEDDSSPAVVSSAIAAVTSATTPLTSDTEIDALSTATTRSVPTSAATESDEESLDVINVTSTALIAASLSSASSASVASASASKAAEKEDNEVGGLNKTSLIAIIAIASGVGLIAAVWT